MLALDFPSFCGQVVNWNGSRGSIEAWLNLKRKSAIKRTCSEQTVTHWKVPQAMMVLAGKQAGLRGENRWKQDGYEKYEWKEIKTQRKESLDCLKSHHGHEKQPLNCRTQEGKKALASM